MTFRYAASSATITMRASSSEIACRAPPISTVTGPPSGAFSTTRTCAPGRNPDLAEVAQDLRNFVGDAADDGAAAARRSARAERRRVRGSRQISRRNRMAVRAGLRIAEQRHQPVFDALRDRVLEHARFGMHFVPRHAEHVGEQPLGQAVPPQDAHADLQAFARQFHLAARDVLDEAVLVELLQHAGDRRRRDAQRRGEARRRHARALVLEAIDGFEILLDRLGKMAVARHVYVSTASTRGFEFRGSAARAARA